MDLLTTLAQLETAQLVRPIAEADASYLFKHTLTQESVYEAMLKTRRVELHRAVALAIEGLCDGQLEQNAAVLALHYQRAGVEDKAFYYSAMAGDVAARAYAQPEALSFYRRALAIAQRIGDPSWNSRVREIYSNAGRVLEVTGDHLGAIAIYEEMMAFGQRAGDLAMEADGLAHLLTVQGVIGKHPNMDLELERALDLARQSGDQALVGRALWNLGLAIRFQDPEHAIEYFQQALDHARSAGLRELAAFAMSDLAMENQILGRWQTSAKIAQQALAEFQAMDNKPMMTNAFGLLSEAHYARGEPELARAAASQGLDTSLAIENLWGIGYNQWCLYSLYADSGEYDIALPLSERLLDVSRKIASPIFWGLTNMYLCLAFVELNQLEHADRCFQEGNTQARAVGGATLAGTADGIQARLLVAQNKIDQARSLLQPYWAESALQSGNLWGYTFLGAPMGRLALIDNRIEDGMHLCEVLLRRLSEQELRRSMGEMLYTQGLLRERAGDLTGAVSDLARAESLARAARNNLLLFKVESDLARLYSACGDDEHSSEALAKAQEIVQMIAGRIPDAALRDSFLERDDIRALTLPQDH